VNLKKSAQKNYKKVQMKKNAVRENLLKKIW